MSRPRFVLGTLVMVLALVAAACTAQEPDITAEDQVAAGDRPDEAANGEAANGEPTGEVYTFTAVDLDFPEAPTEITAGEVTFELHNEGNLPHNVVVDELDNRLVVEADGGETATGTVTLEPGEYRYHCDVPGHEDQMNGNFTVSE